MYKTTIKTAIKSILVFFGLLLLAFSFPLQVMALSPIPSLWPYLIIILLFLFSFNRYISSDLLIWNMRRPIIFSIFIYILLVLIQTLWQMIFEFISIENGISALVNFLLPVLFFIYFRAATNKEIRFLLYAMSITGLVVGAYFIYDSFTMLVLHEVNDYSQKAFQYSQFRGHGQDINNARITAGYRSHGLLESHSITAAWIVLGCFSALTLLPFDHYIKRTIVIFLYGASLLIGLNFTSIIGFVFVIFLMEYRGYTLYRAAISKRVILLTFVIIFILVFFEKWLSLLPNSMSEGMYVAISSNLTEQIELINGKATLSNTSYFGGLINGLFSFSYNMQDFPIGVLIGDGFGAFGISKGGDYGIVETLHRFGLPMFLILIIGLITVICRAIRQIEDRANNSLPATNILWFAVSVIIYILFNEVHYTIWSAKSILPIIFICLAIFDRYLYSSFQYSKHNDRPVA